MRLKLARTKLRPNPGAMLKSTMRARQLSLVNELMELLLDPYRIEHLKLTAKCALELADHFPRLGSEERYELAYAGLAHDLMKVKEVDPTNSKVQVKGKELELDLNRYVRLNLDTLKPFGLDIYFNTDIQLHSLASGMFVHSELGIDDPRILYPIFFHSCPILPVYEQLDETTKLMVDIITVADKLSSGQLKPNKCTIDLRLAIFGQSGLEFNFTAGIYLARLIHQGNSTEKYSQLMTEYYRQRWIQQNPIAELINQPVKVKKLKVKKESGGDGQEKGTDTGLCGGAVAGDPR